MATSETWLGDAARERLRALTEDPTAAWAAAVEAGARSDRLASDALISEATAGGLRFVCISDTHGKHFAFPELPAGDVLIHAGDFSRRGGPDEMIDFANYLSKAAAKFKQVIVVSGNHELTLDPAMAERSGCFREGSSATGKGGSALDSPEAVVRLLRQHCLFVSGHAVDLPVSLAAAPLMPSRKEMRKATRGGARPGPDSYRFVEAGLAAPGVVVHEPPPGSAGATQYGPEASAAPRPPASAEAAAVPAAGAAAAAAAADPPPAAPAGIPPKPEGYIRVTGYPHQPLFCGWAFNVPRGEPIAKIWREIPSDTDVLITHGPPLGQGDRCWRGNRAGCVDLLLAVTGRIKPAVHVFGHIHEDPGISTDGTTAYINAAAVNLRYGPANPPICFQLPLPAAALAGGKPDTADFPVVARRAT
ncbi:hypothetical protein FNF31_01677 [Cafeteria roenbergensis]|uniref:Calcineurin-like phosphoesterase domain-containing protein n=1 Tax=Cafeteria roenbergensis TaxID=33653 RepID=A0A5A8DP56_CAFRO|nr:hypothetical protein FNF31_01677 [Cafeteria roenbergensis]